MRYLVVAVMLAFASSSASALDTSAVRAKTLLAAGPVDEADLCAVISGLVALDARNDPTMSAIPHVVERYEDTDRWWIARAATLHEQKNDAYIAGQLRPNMTALLDLDSVTIGFYFAPCEDKRQAYLRAAAKP